jgi:hypothetical protein
VPAIVIAVAFYPTGVIPQPQVPAVFYQDPRVVTISLHQHPGDAVSLPGLPAART